MFQKKSPNCSSYFCGLKYRDMMLRWTMNSFHYLSEMKNSIAFTLKKNTFTNVDNHAATIK